MKKLIKAIAWLLLLVFLIALTFVLLVITDSGTQLLSRITQNFVPELQIQELEGSAVNDLRLKKLTWETDQQQIQLDNVYLKNDLNRLTDGVLQVDTLEADTLTVTIPTASDSPSPQIALPINLDIKQLKLKSLIIHYEDKTHTVNDVQLTAHTETDKLVISSLKAQPLLDQQPVNIDLNGTTDINPPYAINSNIKLDYENDEHGKAAGQFAIEGDINTYQLKGKAQLDSSLYGDGVLDIAATGTPKDLAIQSLTIDALQGKANAKGEVSWQDKVDWKLDLNLENIHTEKLSPDCPAVLSSRFNTQGNWQDGKAKGVIDLQDLSGKFQDYPLLASGKIQLDGNQANIEKMDIQALDGTANATGNMQWGDALQWNLSLNTDKIKTDKLLPKLPATLNSTFTTTGQIKDQQLSGVIELAKLDGELQGHPLSSTGQIKLNNQQATLNNVKLDALGGTANATGNVKWEDKIEWDFGLKTDKIQTDKLLPDLPATITSDFTTTGSLKDDQLDGFIQLKKLDGKLHDYPLSASGKINLKNQQATLDNFKINALDGTANASGDVSWEDETKWDLQLVTNKIRTKKILPDWPAVLTSEFATQGSQKGDVLKAVIDLKSLSGSLQDYPLAGSGKIQINNQKINVDQLKLSSGSNTLFANGQASEPFDLQWKIDGKKLQQLYKGLSGKLQGSGTLAGTIERPKVQAKLKGQSLKYQDYRLAALDLDIQQQQQNYQIDAAISSLKTADQTIKNIKLDGTGTLEKHRLNVQLQHPDADVTLKANGGWRQKEWKGTLQKLALHKTAAGNWDLASPTAIKVSETRFNSERFCLNNQSASACAAASWKANSGVSAKGNLKQIPLTLLKPWLPEDIKATGIANADFNIVNQSGTFSIRLPDNQITLASAPKQMRQLRYQKAQIDSQINGKQIKTRFNTHIQKRGDVAGNITVNLADATPNSRLQGNVQLDMPDISWINAIVPEIQHLKGKLNSKLQVSGTIDKPQIVGKTQLSNASFSLLETGTDIQNMNLTMNSQSADRAAITGSLQSGEGTLNITGNMSNLSDLSNWKANVRLQGSNLDYMDTYEMKGKVSPNLTINATPKNVAITGTLTIPETKITLNELPVTGITESDDVVIVRGGKQQSGTKKSRHVKKSNDAFQIQPNVAVVIGDKVTFSGFGLNAKLAGKFQLRQSQQELFAQGSLNITDGSYKAYGQDLAITRGRLVFNGPVDNPGMDIKAVRTIEREAIEVGIHLTGTVQKPETTLFSTSSDPLSQTDILSYLLTGRTLAEASNDDSSMLLSALTSLGVSGGEGIARNIGTQLGLDSVNINTSGGFETSELELGKRLGTNLYLRYIVGLFDSMQRIAIEYRINKRLTLEAQSGVNQGFDLIYKMERN